MIRKLLHTTLLLPILVLGCHSVPTPNREAPVAAQRQQVESQRQELDLIPPPSKSRYLAVHSLETWENPYLTVQPGMITLHVLVADANPSGYGAGGIMRPIGARRQDLNISLNNLAEALAAIPQSCWPYGRVAAIEEAHKVPAAGEPQVRRNMEAAVRTLNDLGIVVYEWNEAGPR